MLKGDKDLTMLRMGPFCLQLLPRSDKRANLGCCVVNGSSSTPRLQVQVTGACRSLETSSECRGSHERCLTGESRPPFIYQNVEYSRLVAILLLFPKSFASSCTL